MKQETCKHCFEKGNRNNVSRCACKKLKECMEGTCLGDAGAPEEPG